MIMGFFCRLLLDNSWDGIIDDYGMIMGWLLDNSWDGMMSGPSDHDLWFVDDQWMGFSVDFFLDNWIILGMDDMDGMILVIMIFDWWLMDGIF